MNVNPNVVFRVLGDGAVLVDLSTNEIFELNETAAAIWVHLDRGDTPEAIVDALVAAFEVDVAAARDQLDELVTALAARGLLVP